MGNKYCKYCWPTKRKNHISLYFSYYMKKIDTFISRPYKYLRISKNKQKREDYVWELILEFLSLLKVVVFIDEPDESKLYNRSLIFFKEAKKRNLNVKAIKFFGVYVNDFKLIHNNKIIIMRVYPLLFFRMIILT